LDFAGGNWRVLTQVFRAEQSLFFGCDRREVDRAARLLGGLSIGASEFKQDAAAGAVVHSAVVDIVAGHVGANAEVIVMRGVHDRFVL